MLDHVYREETHSVSASEGVKGSQSGREWKEEGEGVSEVCPFYVSLGTKRGESH